MKHTYLFSWFLVSLLTFTTWNTGWSQDRSDIFNPKTSIVWLGVDFSEARYFGDDKDAVSGDAIKSVFERINDLIINESDKYNLRNAFHNKAISTEIQAVTTVNDATDDSAIVSEDKGDYTRMDDAFIQNMVKRYALDSKKGVGVVFIVEGMDKSRPEAAIWVTYIRMSDQSVLLTKRLTGKAGGFGLRNFWASAIHKVLLEVEKKEYNKWKRQK